MKAKLDPRRRRVALCLASQLVLCVPGLLGATAHAQAVSAPTQILTSAELPAPQAVLLNLNAYDKKGKPVFNLEAADLAIAEERTPLNLSDLRLVRDTPQTQHLITLVFDRMDSAAAHNARVIAAKILKLLPGGNLSFAVLALDARLDLLQPYSTDRAAVTNAIALATSGNPTGSSVAATVQEEKLVATARTGSDTLPPGGGESERGIARLTLAALRNADRLAQDQHDSSILPGLAGLSSALASAHGRKALIYFSPGLQVNVRTADQLRAAADQANRAGVTILAIDLNALDPQASNQMQAAISMGQFGASRAQNPSGPLTGPQTGFASTAGAGVDAQIANTITGLETDSPAGSKGSLARLAESTGGTLINGGGDLRKPLRALIDEMSTWYEASFAPANQQFDGSFHRVSITARRPGVFLHAPTGYLDLPPGQAGGTSPFEAPLLKALAASPAPSDIDLHIAVIRLGDLPDGSTTELAIEVPLTALERRKDPNTRLFSVHLSILAQVRDAGGAVVAHFSEEVHRHGALEAADSTGGDAVTFQRHFTAHPGRYTLEAAVLDSNSGKLAVRILPFSIDAPTDQLALSDLALIRESQPLNASLDAGEPLRYNGARLVPGVGTTLPTPTKELSLFFMVHPPKQATTGPTTLALKIAENGHVLSTMPLAFNHPGTTAPIPYLATVRSHGFTPGQYELTAVLTAGATSSESHLSFTIPAPDAAASNSSAPTAASFDPSVPATAAMLAATEPSFLVAAAVTAATAPPPEQTDALLAQARSRALAYTSSLPNFMCLELTDRSVDHAGGGDRLKHKDSLAELLSYKDSHETRSVLEVDGHRSTVAPADLQGTTSAGEFGGVLTAIFDPASKAVFTWKEAATLDSEAMQVFTYRVALPDSNFSLTGDGNWSLKAAFHGTVYIESATGATRRVTMEADHLPADFSIHASSLGIDYSYVAINGHDYLLPVRGELRLLQHKHEFGVNALLFRDYRRFGARSHIVAGPVLIPAAN